jgi:ATP-dependent protease ClpP protease subunit
MNMKSSMKSKKRKINNIHYNSETEVDTTDSPSSITHIKDSVYFFTDISDESILKLIEALEKATTYVLEHTHDIYNARVYLYINSLGGEANAGLSGMDHIRLNRVPIVTVADGYVASAATLLLLGGQERKIMRNAKILIHQLSTAFWGKFNDLLDEVANSKELMDNFKEIYKNNTRMSSKKIESLLNKELHLNATEAFDLYFVDEIW